jgi:PKD repeat protein
VASYAWDFGDGSTGTGKTVSHPYGQAGDYQVKLTVTDDGGATDSVTKTVTTVAAPAGPLATDEFGRTQTNGWGSADKGGAWTTTGTASLFSVNGGKGTIRLASPGAGPRAALNGISSTSSDVSVAVSLDKLADGGGSFVSVGARTIGTSDYRAKVKVGSNGALVLYLTKVVSNAETTLVTANLPSSLNYTVGSTMNIRVQASGTSPTTVRARVWKGGTAEPTAWQLTTTDSTASLQGAGGVGVATYLATTVTNQPVLVSFDSFSAVAVAN